MLEFAKKGIYAGLGLASMTKDKIEELAKEFSERAKMNEDEGRKLAEYLQQEGKKARDGLRQQIDGAVEAATKRLNCVRKIEELEARIAALEAACGLTDAAAAESPEASAAPEAKAEQPENAVGAPGKNA